MDVGKFVLNEFVPVHMLFPDKSTFKFSAVCVAVEIGLFKSLVLLTFGKPTMDCVMPVTMPVIDIVEPFMLAISHYFSVMPSADSPRSPGELEICFRLPNRLHHHFSFLPEPSRLII